MFLVGNISAPPTITDFSILPCANTDNVKNVATNINPKFFIVKYLIIKTVYIYVMTNLFRLFKNIFFYAKVFGR